MALRALENNGPADESPDLKFRQELDKFFDEYHRILLNLAAVMVAVNNENPHEQNH